MKLSGQKIKSCVRLKHCLKLIYGKIFGIFSRPCTFTERKHERGSLLGWIWGNLARRAHAHKILGESRVIADSLHMHEVTSLR